MSVTEHMRRKANKKARKKEQRQADERGNEYPGVYAVGRKLYVSFTHAGRRYRKSTPYIDSPAGWEDAYRFKLDIERQIFHGTFDLEAAFPSEKSAGMTLRDLLLDWHENTTTNRPRTAEAHAHFIRVHLIPAFGDRPIGSISTGVIEDYVARLALGASSKNHLLAVLRGAFERAVKYRWIKRNPMIGIKNYPCDQKAPRPFSVAEERAVVAELSPLLAGYFVVAVELGLRPHEQLGLQFAAIDWVQRKVAVVQGLVKGEPAPLKNRFAERVLPLSERAYQALVTLHQAAPGGQAWVFVDPETGRPPVQDAITKACQRAMRRAGVPCRPMYQTRHTYASRQLSRGESPFFVARMLGHADLVMMYRVYAEFIWDEYKQAQPLSRGRHRAVDTAPVPVN